MQPMNHAWRARAALLAAIAAGLLVPPPPAAAQEPEVIRRLQSEPVTMFDAGIKRLRRSALDAAARLGSTAEPAPATRVWYDAKAGIIEIQFRYEVSAADKEKLTRERCAEKRRAAVRETFNVGRTIYTVPVSFDERVRRRLASLFLREPIDNVKDLAALGQALARLTFVTVRIVADGETTTVSCRDRVAPEVGSR